MSFADSLPDDALDLTVGPCTCRWDWRADPWDRDYGEFRAYPRSYPVITFSAACGIQAHRAKAGSERHFNHWHDG